MARAPRLPQGAAFEDRATPADGPRVIVETASRSAGNPVGAAYGALVRDAGSGGVLASEARLLGECPADVAEYSGLIAGLRLARGLDSAVVVEVWLSSRLVIEQMAGRRPVEHPDLNPLAARARALCPPDVRWTLVPPGRNADAGRLADQAMDADRP